MAAAFVLSPASAGADGRERVVDLPLKGGDHQRVLYLKPEDAWATVVMLPGGAGNVGIEHDGAIRHPDNFVVRSRALWTDQGVAVVIPDTIDRANLRGQRSSPRFAEIVDGLIAFASTPSQQPVFLLGTSQGSIAAMNGAAHAKPGTLAGVVLTESVSRMGGSHETVFDAHPDAVHVPALVIANRDDRCTVAPPDDARRIAAAMTAAPSVEVLMVAGGIVATKRPCGSLSPHGYYGIESEVVNDVVRWMRQHTR
ncbi:lysophospholipase [Bradyrhizobium sp. Ai1a-2]|uniref:alpha/beta hydrolase n=1 Tax=Bradyrhizobium sp. Ai1a-2 TaxID=196490 RepID=UPI001FCAE140|nr:lysophospholipase [Bradyrhizobium sp. Ai1a-2]